MEEPQLQGLGDTTLCRKTGVSFAQARRTCMATEGRDRRVQRQRQDLGSQMQRMGSGDKVAPVIPHVTVSCRVTGEISLYGNVSPCGRQVHA